MQIFVTGARGRIGAAVVQRLLSQGHRAIAVDVVDPTGSVPDEVVVDITDADAVRRAMDGSEAVVHAGAIAYDRPGFEVEIDHINVFGTLNVLRAMGEHQIGVGVLFSSINAMGIVGARGDRPDQLPFDDFHEQRPDVGYQLTKLLGEKAAESYVRKHGMRLTSLRPTFVASQEWYHRFRERPHAPEYVVSELGGYVDREDVVDAVIAALALRGPGHEGLLLSAPDTVFTRNTADLVREQLPDVPWPRVSLEEYVAEDPRRALIDSAHAEQVLGVRPTRRWQDVLDS